MSQKRTSGWWDLSVRSIREAACRENRVIGRNRPKGDTHATIQQVWRVIAQQPLQSGPVVGLVSYRGIDREAAAVGSLAHFLRIVFVEIALTDEPAKHPLSNPRLHPLDIGVAEYRLAETHGLLASLLRLEYAVDHTTV